MIFDEVCDFCHNKNNRSIFVFVYVLALLSYSYLFAGTVYNNHDLPNSFYSGYPSFTTTSEGRFIGDILYQLQGGSAIPAFDMAIAVAIQILNGFLVATCLGITSYRAKLCMITIITIHPAITDYYSWGGVAINFCIADTFAIIAVIFCSRKGMVNTLISTLSAVLSVATYQPKVSTITTIFSLLLISKIMAYSGKAKSAKKVLVLSGKMLLILTSSAATYLLFFLGTVPETTRMAASSDRLHFNSFAEFIPQIKKVIEYTSNYFLSSQNFLHPNDYFIPAITVVFFVFVALMTIFNHTNMVNEKLKFLALFIVIFCLLPFSMNIVFLITTKAYATDGRFFGTYAYTLSFFLAYLIDKTDETKLQFVWFSVFAGLAVFFVFDNAQYSYRGYMQNRFEYSFVTRIATRLENIIQPLKTYKLVFIGDLPWKAIRSKLSRRGNIEHRKVIANYDQPGFIHYRRVEYLNFLMGREVFASPNTEDIARAKKYAMTAEHWPAASAVAVLDDVLVVLF
jgi:hypothetical protein